MKKLLFITVDVAGDLNSGYRIRTHHILCKLVEFYEVSILHVGDAPIDQRDIILDGIKKYFFIKANKKSSINLVFSWLRRLPFLMYRFSPSKLQNVFDKLLCELNTDTVFLNMTVFNLSIPSRISIVLDQHDIISHTSKEAYLGENGFLNKFVFFGEMLRWKYFEPKYYKLIDRKNLDVISVKDSDAAETAELISQGRVIVIPNGHDVVATGLSRKLMPRKLIHIGTSHPRNINALKELYLNVLPKVRELSGNILLEIIGAFELADLAFIKTKGQNISVHTFVSDVKEFFTPGAICVLPYKMGAGSKLKVFEIMASGIPVVGTSLTFSGIQLGSLKSRVCSESAVEMAKLVHNLIVSDDEYQSVSKAGIDVVKDNQWEKLLAHVSFSH